jgi:hypothetical protein
MRVARDRHLNKWIPAARIGISLGLFSITCGALACPTGYSSSNHSAGFVRTSSDTSSDEALNQAASKLKEIAAATGRPVRVLVEVQPSTRSPESRTLDQTKEQLTKVMRDAGAVVAQPIEGTPLVILELTAQQIDVLLSTDMIKTLQEDKPESLY